LICSASAKPLSLLRMKDSSKIRDSLSTVAEAAGFEGDACDFVGERLGPGMVDY
jgi:hypothetical protein